MVSRSRAVRKPSFGFWLRAGLIVLAGALTYWNSLSGPFIFDDNLSIVTNRQIRQLSPLSRVLFPARELPVAGRPLVNLSFAINYAIGGLDVRGYHIWNIAIHILCALVLFGVVRRTLNLPGLQLRFADRSIDLAFACAVIWMLHPLQTEAVDYLTQRTESMMGLFYLLALYASIRASDSPRAVTWQVVSVLACASGMACKESMVTAPLMVILYDRVFVFDSLKQAFRARWRLYAGLVTTWLELAALMWTGPRIHSAGFSSGLHPWIYLLNQTVMIVRYLRLAVWPRSLVLDYGVPRPLTLGQVIPDALAVAFLLLITVATLIRRPKLGFLGAWFFITLAPTSSVVPIATEVGAERRMYVPLAAIVVLAVTVGSLLWDRLRATGARRTEVVPARAATAGGIILLVLVSAALAAGTISRNREYVSGVSLASTVLERRPHGRAHHLLGIELIAAGHREEGLMHLREAICDEPRARYTLGMELFDEGKLDEAIEHLQELIRQEPLLLEVVSARETIGRALETLGKLNEAAEQFRTILKMTPSYVDAHGRLAQVLFAQQKFEEASVRYREFLKYRPNDVGAITNLGIALAATGHPDEAILSFRRAVEVDPQNSNAHRNLANALLDKRDFEGASDHAQRALILKPADPVAHTILGLARPQKAGSTKPSASFGSRFRSTPTTPRPASV